MPISLVRSVSQDADYPAYQTGVNAISGRALPSGTGAPGTGTLRAVFFTPRVSSLMTNVKMFVTSAASGLTLLRIGLYAVDGAGLLTLVGSTASNTTAMGVSGAMASMPLQVPTQLVVGQRYALAILAVGTTTPTLTVFPGAANPALMRDGFATGQAFSGALTGLADLPATILGASLSANSVAPWAAWS